MTTYRDAVRALGGGRRTQATITRRHDGTFILTQGDNDVELSAIAAVNLSRFVAANVGRRSDG